MKAFLLTIPTFIISLAFLSAQVPKLGADADWCITEPIFFEKPECWISTNPIANAQGLQNNVTITSDAYVGRQALKLETLMDNNGEIHPAVAIMKDELFGRPDLFTGYYKADINYGDYAGIRISLLSEGHIIGWGEYDFHQSKISYTSFELPLQYISSAAIPDSFTLALYSSVDHPRPGTRIVFDAVKFEEAIDVTIPLVEKFSTRITPNPATSEILVMVPWRIGQVDIRVFDDSGAQVILRTFEEQIRIDVSNLTNGIYMFEIRIRDKDNTFYDQGRFNILRQRL